MEEARPPKCSCPWAHTDSGPARHALDQFCPIHGVGKQELPHCATCACVEVPIVQTPEVAARQVAERADETGE